MTMFPNPAGLVAFLTPSTNEIVIIVILAFLLFGAKKIPELMRSLGRAQGEFQNAKKQFDKEVSATVEAPAAPAAQAEASSSAPAAAEAPTPAPSDADEEASSDDKPSS